MASTDPITNYQGVLLPPDDDPGYPGVVRGGSPRDEVPEPGRTFRFEPATIEVHVRQIDFEPDVIEVPVRELHFEDDVVEALLRRAPRQTNQRQKQRGKLSTVPCSRLRRGMQVTPASWPRRVPTTHSTS